MEARAAAYRDILEEQALLTVEQAAAMVGWTPSGFRRVATRENLPRIKLGHKQPELYRLQDLNNMLNALKRWPKGRPL
jgi:hypothetical protein